MRGYGHAHSEIVIAAGERRACASVRHAAHSLLTYPSIRFNLRLQTYYPTRLSNLAAADSRARHETAYTASPLTLVLSALEPHPNPDYVANLDVEGCGTNEPLTDASSRSPF